jgi:hypothetical protein
MLQSNSTLFLVYSFFGSASSYLSLKGSFLLPKLDLTAQRNLALKRISLKYKKKKIKRKASDII